MLPLLQSLPQWFSNYFLTAIFFELDSAKLNQIKNWVALGWGVFHYFCFHNKLTHPCTPQWSPRYFRRTTLAFSKNVLKITAFKKLDATLIYIFSMDMLLIMCIAIITLEWISILVG